MAKTPAQRFQNADELVSVLEGGRSVTFTTDATMAMPSMAGVRMSSAPTTPLPRATGTRPPVGGEGAPAGPVIVEKAHRSALSGVLLWLIIVGAVFGHEGFYAYKQGLIFAKSPGGGCESARAPDTTGLRRPDISHRQAHQRGVAPAEPPPPSAEAPGRLLYRAPRWGARNGDGQPVRAIS
jgi:hypothetical protein